MRILPVRHGTILIASAAGEFRNISVSGFAKVRVFWLFRNSCILDFSRLNKKQQQLIAHVWHAGARAGPADVVREPIGTVEAFLPDAFLPDAFTPQLDQPATRIAEPVRARAGISRVGRLPNPAILTAVGILLVAIFLTQSHRSRQAHGVMPPSGAAAVAAVNPVSSAVTVPARTLAKPTPSVAALRPPAREASSSPPAHSAIAHPEDASLLKVELLRVKALQPAVAPAVAVRPRALGKPEVIVRVRVDRDGRAQAFQIVRGNRDISAALTAVRRWSFQPCAGDADCKHLLKFTNYGDAFSVQMID